MKRRWKILLAMFTILLMAYLAFTHLMPQPKIWSKVSVGMSREATNALLVPANWQRENDAY